MNVVLIELTGPMRWLTFGLDAASAVLGMIGTYFMTKRFGLSFFSGAFFAILGVLFYFVGRGQAVRDFYTADAQDKSHIPESPADVAFGLNLLFVAFFAQLARIVLSFFFAKT